jgi:hypothetical protein
MNVKKNILKHLAKDHSFPNIAPAKNFIPDWFKKQTRYENEESKALNVLPLKMTYKACYAFTDSFTTGYIMPLAVDIAVRQTEGGPSITWEDPNNKYVVLRDKNTNNTLPTPNGFANQHYVWETKHSFKIPKGYSAIVTHPLNRFDLPFLTLSGIIDGEMTVYNGNIPVFFNSTFEGIISAGTPIAQIILFKREDWTNKIDKDIFIEADYGMKKSLNTAFGWYKNTIWKKKNYD